LDWAAAVAIIGELSHILSWPKYFSPERVDNDIACVGNSVGPVMFIAEQKTPAIIFGITGILFGFPAIGGFVTVGQILSSYGNCIRI
jgi:hypothetical protein